MVRFSSAPTMCFDEAKIVTLLHAYTPAVAKHSWKLSLERQRQGLSLDGAYFRLGSGRGGVNVHASDWKRILEAHGIVMAEHWRSSYARSVNRPRIYGHCWIKSRFGETKVERSAMGAMRFCDNAEAREFYTAKDDAARSQVLDLIDARDLPAAIAKKKALQRAREMI